MTITLETLVVGALTGLCYAVLAAGLVLVYRASRVINFAHGEIGAFGAAVLAKLVLDLRWNFVVAFAAVLLMGGAIGVVVELTVVRRLFHAPRLVLLVATIGVSQVLLFAQAALPGINRTARYPTPIRRSAELGDVLLRGEHFLIIAFVPAVIATLALFLTRTPYGVAIRAAAANPSAARLAGVNVKHISTVVWGVAAMLSTATFVLISPVRGTILGQPAAALGPGLLLRALAVALIGGLVSLPLILLGGVLLGTAEAVLFVNVARPGTVDAWIFVALVVLVLVRAKDLRGEDSGWSLGARARPLPPALSGTTAARRLPAVVIATAFVVAAALPLVYDSPSQVFRFTTVLLYALVGISVVVVTGWAGQLSLAQFSFVGLGAVMTAGLTSRGMPFAAAVGFAAAGGGVAAVLVGAPAVRIRGLMLGVTTLGFAVAANGWLLPHRLFLGDRTLAFVSRGGLGPFDLTSHRTYYYLCLIVLVLVAGAASHLRRTGAGRVIIAVRENETAAAAFTVSPTLAKLSAFVLGGVIAALAGGLYAGAHVQFTPQDFGAAESLRVIAMVVIGGIGSVSGAVLGALYVVGLPALFNDSAQARLLTSGVGLLVFLLYLPGGLLQVVASAREGLLRILPKRVDPPPKPMTWATVMPAVEPRSIAPDAQDHPALRAADVVVHFGGLTAVAHVTIEAAAGEIVGLIGTNGAGKSTLMNAVSGYVPMTSGRVELGGVDVTHLPAHLRARHGMARVFQDARLFGDLTVQETVMVALEARQRSELVPSLLRLSPSVQAERRKRAAAEEVIGELGLRRFAGMYISDLSTGTRRVCELACLLAVGAPVILLDEPTAGVAQRETEAFGVLIRRVHSELRPTIVIIEHDMPLIMSLSDRVYCMSAGAVIAEGEPEQIRRDPHVIAAYLGTDARAIERSDHGGGQQDRPPPVPVMSGAARGRRNR